MSRPNVILIVLDTARVSHVYNEEVMPNLNALADDGVRFSNVFTTGPWSLPSHASLFTGQYTSDHRTHAKSPTFDPGVETLATRLQNAGYQTGAYSNNLWVTPGFGFDRGFDTFEVGWELFSDGTDLARILKQNDTIPDVVREFASELVSLNGPKTLMNGLYSVAFWKRFDSGAWMTNRWAKRWLGGTDDPFFFFLNYREPHLEYDPPSKDIEAVTPNQSDPPAADDINQDPWAYFTGETDMSDSDFAALETLYEAELRYLDRRLGELFEYLAETNTLDETMIVVTSDHGENLGDHGLMDHQYCLYDTLLHVPLVVHYPDSVSTGVRDELFELRDLYPTILAEAGVDLPDAERHMLAGSGRDTALAEYWFPLPSMDRLREKYGELPENVLEHDRGLRAIRTGQWKYIQGTDGIDALYDIEDDPNEQTNLAAEHPAVIERLSEQVDSRLDPISASDEQSVETDPGLKKRLEDLGYLQ